MNNVLLAGVGIALFGLACGLSTKDGLGSESAGEVIVPGLLTLVCLYLTWFCFQAPGPLVLFPGITVAFTAGQGLGVFARLAFCRRSGVRG